MVFWLLKPNMVFWFFQTTGFIHEKRVIIPDLRLEMGNLWLKPVCFDHETRYQAS